MIDIITLRGTGEPRNADGTPAGMLASVTDLLPTSSFSFFEPDWPASVGPDPNLWGPSLDTSVQLGTAAAVQAIAQSPNVCGLLSYSLGGICASRILEGVASGQYTNTDGSPLEIAFAVFIANPLRKAGDSVNNLCPATTFGLAGQRGTWPTQVATQEYANPGDIITASPSDSPLRIIAVGISPFSFVEGARLGNVSYLIYTQLLEFLTLNPLVNLERYTTAANGGIGYLTPYPLGQHVLYSAQTMPGTDVIWTTAAANYITAGFA